MSALEACERRNKPRYSTEEEALQVAAVINLRRDDARRGKRFWRPYLCPCGQWHLTSRPQNRKAG